MAGIELYLRGDLDFANSGEASAEGILHLNLTKDAVTVDFLANRLGALPLWAQRILREEFPKAARCKGCGLEAAESLKPCRCGRRIFSLSKSAWRGIESRLITYMRTAPKRAQRPWDEALLPGYFTGGDLKEIFKMQKGLCYFCSEPLEDKFMWPRDRRHWHADHLVPVSRRTATNWPSNIVAVCARCNSRRSNRRISMLWSLLQKEKGRRYVQKRRSEVRKFDEQRRALDAVNQASLKDACESMERSFRQELKAQARGGVPCSVRFTKADSNVYVDVGLLSVMLPGSFHKRIAQWSEKRCGEFGRHLIETARVAGVLLTEPF